MTDQQRSQLYDIVKQKIATIQQEILELEELTKPVAPDSAIGRVSRMDAINNKAINDAALREKKKILQRLEKTLDRIYDTNYGICQKCGSEIPFGRLEYLPYTIRCVQCMR